MRTLCQFDFLTGLDICSWQIFFLHQVFHVSKKWNVTDVFCERCTLVIRHHVYVRALNFKINSEPKRAATGLIRGRVRSEELQTVTLLILLLESSAFVIKRRDHMHEVTSPLLIVFYHIYENLNLKTPNIGFDLSLYPQHFQFIAS